VERTAQLAEQAFLDALNALAPEQAQAGSPPAAATRPDAAPAPLPAQPLPAHPHPNYASLYGPSRQKTPAAADDAVMPVGTSSAPAPVVGPGSNAGKFAPLSSLPEARRLPPRRPDVRPAPASDSDVPASATTSGGAGSPPSLLPRQLPGLPSVKPKPGGQIGFNCPSCLAILIIKQPETYDGRAAPCPNCNALILPPRLAPKSPFTLVRSPSEAPRGLPAAPPLPAPESAPAEIQPIRAKARRMFPPAQELAAKAAMF
jgi:hypothetical protein